MPTLRTRTRITSVKSTQRITSAMKMVAAAACRCEQGSPYVLAERMERMLARLLAAPAAKAARSSTGTGDDKVHLWSS